MTKFMGLQYDDYDEAAEAVTRNASIAEKIQDAQKVLDSIVDHREGKPLPKKEKNAFLLSILLYQIMQYRCETMVQERECISFEVKFKTHFKMAD